MRTDLVERSCALITLLTLHFSYFSLACIHTKPSWHFNFGGEIGNKLETPSGKGASDYMIWGDYEETRAVIKAMWERLKTLTASMRDNSSGDFWTRVTLGGV